MWLTQTIHEHQNLRTSERIATALAGAGLFALAVKWPRVRRPLATASTALLLRSATGYCPAYAAAGVSSKDTDTRAALSGRKGAHVTESITIAAPSSRVYELWRDPAQLGAALPPGIEVERLDDLRWRWSLRGLDDKGPAAAWTSRLINDEPGRLLAWRTVGESDIVSAGSVRFVSLPDDSGTEVHVHFQYSPPLGRAGAALASLFGRGADAMVRDSLEGIRARIEETARIEAVRQSHREG